MSLLPQLNLPVGFFKLLPPSPGEDMAVVQSNALLPSHLKTRTECVQRHAAALVLRYYKPRWKKETTRTECVQRPTVLVLRDYKPRWKKGTTRTECVQRPAVGFRHFSKMLVRLVEKKSINFFLTKLQSKALSPSHLKEETRTECVQSREQNDQRLTVN